MQCGYEIHAILHALEGLNEFQVCHAYGLDTEDTSVVLDETGTPAGWHPLIANYDTLPDLTPDLPPVPQELIDYLASHERDALAPDALARLKGRLRALYLAGPGAKVQEEAAEGAAKNGEGVGGVRMTRRP